MFDAFLYFPCGTVKGETQDHEMKDKGAFELTTFSLGAENTLNIGSASGGAGAGKATFKEFSFAKSTDAGSCPLFLKLVTGKHFAEAIIELRRSGGADDKSGVCFIRYHLSLVAVKDISWSGSSGDDVPTEEVTMEYGAIKIEYFKQDKTGQMAKAEAEQGEVKWSRVNNMSLYPVS